MNSMEREVLEKAKKRVSFHSSSPTVKNRAYRREGGERKFGRAIVPSGKGDTDAVETSRKNDGGGGNLEDRRSWTLLKTRETMKWSSKLRESNPIGALE